MRQFLILLAVIVSASVMWSCKPQTSEAQDSAEAVWSTNYKESLQKAQKENKLLLLDFTGSDWCGWCKKLDKEIFATPEFQKYAKENLVLVKLDFPRSIQLSEEVKKQNAELAQKYSIRGYPTIVILDGKESKVGQMGYMRGGPEPFVKAIEDMKKKV